ncbi:MAG: excisionase [Microbacterium sp. 69-7]|uniref:helix-turn-helix domain-containing protein n=1 Tax=Microbacterium sp. 69-7 TaxID=1895784 RepID=UPI00095AC726|nr:helix-turn-helix domain-containing protein [Microbacterium sp. 69-7]OJU43625.1 MAG: excisionase [Microbacterium sp. 69-7]
MYTAGGAQSPEPEILFVAEVAERLRRSVDSVRWLINTKRLKAAKLGGRVVVRRVDLEKFIADAFADAS